MGDPLPLPVVCRDDFCLLQGMLKEGWESGEVGMAAAFLVGLESTPAVLRGAGGKGGSISG